MRNYSGEKKEAIRLVDKKMVSLGYHRIGIDGKGDVLVKIESDQH